MKLLELQPQSLGCELDHKECLLKDSANFQASVMGSLNNIHPRINKGTY